jgi:outer membrane receptor for ferrienterochelin and colicins
MRLSPGRTLLFLLALLLFPAAHALAQTGAVAGTIRDVSTAAPIPDARVEAVAPDGRVGGVTVTGADGTYRIAGLAPGRYALVISGTSLTVRRLEVEVRDGQTSRVDAQVALGNVRLDPLVVSASKRPEKAVSAPSRVEVVDANDIGVRPVTTPVEHLRNVPGVDVASTGVQSSNVVARGFNNIFSGALHALTDNRIAGIPSLRVNFLHMIPSNNEDVARMEVVLGPGAALYGPNTANGILHIITKSPIDEPGTTVSFSGGSQELRQAEFRASRAFGSTFGVKLSGQFLQAREYFYEDRAELLEAQKFALDAEGRHKADLMRATGITEAEADLRIDRIGQRNFDVERWGGEVRADWRPTSAFSTILSAGTSLSGSGIELTGLGAAQVSDWRYSYYQVRTTWNRLFAQAYLNQSDAGDTFLLRNGAPIVDRSRLVVGQIQHGTTLLDGRQNFTYGADYIRTTPVTEGTIHGWYEDDDQTTEYGAYLQSETAITPKVDLVLAGRLDNHSALPDAVFSPRAALVFKPAEGHALRLSYNRAFSTPSSINQFLDLGSTIPDAGLARLGYSLRIQGTGAAGFTFGTPGSYQMRSPFTPTAAGGPAQLVPAAGAPYYPATVQVLAQGAAAAGNPMDPQFVQYLLSLNPASLPLDYFNVVDQTRGALAGLVLDDLAPIRESTSTTLEAGYKGLLGGRLLLAADVWWSRRENLVTPLTIQTPLLFLNGQALGAFLVPRFMADLGMSQAQAQATAAALIGSATSPGLATIPVGVVSSSSVNANGAQLLVTYVNVDETIDLWGTDFSARALLGGNVSVAASVSTVSEDVFRTERAGIVTLNAPKLKGTLSADYNPAAGFFGEVRMRYSDGFPVNSGVYIGTRCLPENASSTNPLLEDCVRSYTLFDLNLGYRLPMVQGATIGVNVNNVLDEAYRPFPGAPTLGRMVIARVKYEF